MTIEQICPIWGTPATITINPATMACTADSPRAGGRYSMSHSVYDDAVATITNDSLKARITTWLIDQREQGTECPEISSETIKQIEQRQPLPVHERADRLIKYLAQKSSVIGSPVILTFSNLGVNHSNFSLEMFFRDRTDSECLAWAESHSADSPRPELFLLLQYLVDQGWIIQSKPSRATEHIITVQGYARLAELETKQVNSSQGFVAMWFPDTKNKDYDLIKNAYEQGIYAGIDQAGYKPYRVDRDEHNDQITDKIISEIKRSKFLIADFTHGNTGVRGGVYYEAGFAKGLNIPVIFTCLEERFSTEIIHFDISHQNFIRWETPADLCEKIKNRITGSEIGWGPGKPQ